VACKIGLIDVFLTFGGNISKLFFYSIGEGKKIREKYNCQQIYASVIGSCGVRQEWPFQFRPYAPLVEIVTGGA
jgi:hypothetical protein